MASSGGKGSPCCCTKKAAKVYLVVGLLFVLFGALGFSLVDRWFQDLIDEQLVLSPHSKMFSAWKSPPIPVYMQFYTFSIVNPLEMKEGKPPFVEQRGPYSYRVYQDKLNLTWNNNDTVSFDKFTKYIFDPDMSCDTCDPQKDKLTIPNLPLVILSEVSKMYPGASFVFRVIFSLFGEDFFKQLTVQDLLWGYEDPVFELFAELKAKFKLDFLPKIDPIFTLMYNNTFDGVVTAYTGANGISKVSVWQKWKGKAEVGLWTSPWANMINGSDGTQFSPGTKTSDKLYAFFVQLCRSVYFEYDSPFTVHGINTLRFTYPEKVWQNTTLNPDNAGFCPNRCFPTGILDVSVCKDTPVTLPVILTSEPHFYQGDPSLVQAVEGLSPNKEDHATFLDVEPHFGLPLHVSIRLQLNAFVEAVDGIPQTKGIKSVFLPLVYFNNSVTIDSSTADLMKEVLIPMKVIPWVSIGFLCLGCLLITVLPVQIMLQKRKEKKMRERKMKDADSETKPLLTKKTEST